MIPGDNTHERCTIISLLARRLRVLAQPSMIGVRLDALPDRMRQLNEVGDHTLDAIVLVGTEPVDLIAAAAIRRLSNPKKRNGVSMLLDVLAAGLDENRAVALYYALPDNARGVVGRNPKYIGCIAPFIYAADWDDEIAAALEDLDDLGAFWARAVEADDADALLRWLPRRYRHLAPAALGVSAV